MAVLLKVKEPVPALQRPKWTPAKRSEAFANKIDWAKLKARPRTVRPVHVVPGLDPAALSRCYGMAAAQQPKVQRGEFAVFLDMQARQLDRLVKEQSLLFLIQMEKQGWDLVTSESVWREAGWPGPLRLYPGPYPYFDLRDGVALFDRRGYYVEGWFRFRDPKPVRIELPAEYREPLVLR